MRPSHQDGLNIFGLPAELRTQIFELLLVSAEPIDTFPNSGFHRQANFSVGKCTSSAKSKPPALTRVNRQLRQEALAVFYGCNTFELHTEEPWVLESRRWLTEIQDHNFAHLLKRVRIRVFMLGASTFAITLTRVEERGFSTVSAACECEFQDRYLEADTAAMMSQLDTFLAGLQGIAPTAQDYLRLLETLPPIYKEASLAQAEKLSE